MKAFIGTKIIKAEPMSQHAFAVSQNKDVLSPEDQEGYMVVYPDGYKSWSPKDVFESAYREVTSEESSLIK